MDMFAHAIIYILESLSVVNILLSLPIIILTVFLCYFINALFYVLVSIVYRRFIVWFWQGSPYIHRYSKTGK